MKLWECILAIVLAVIITQCAKISPMLANAELAKGAVNSRALIHRLELLTQKQAGQIEVMRTQLSQVRPCLIKKK